MKRLLFYYPTPFDTLRGGIERVTNKLAKELNKYGYDVFYLHLKNETTLGLKGKLDYSVQIDRYINSCVLMYRFDT